MKKTELMTELNCSEKELEQELKESQSKHLKSSRDRDKTRRQCSFERLSKNLPPEGEVLESEERSIVKVYEDWKKRDDGKPSRILYCHAKIDSKATGWYLHSKEYGLKCMISLRSAHRVIEGENGVFVQALKVIRQSNSGKSLVCEVVE